MTTIVRRTALVDFSGTGFAGTVRVEYDFLSKESEQEVKTWLGFVARTKVMKEFGYRLGEIKVDSLQLEN